MNRSGFVACLVIGSCLTQGAPPAIAGPLTPPGGPILPTPGPEPRIPINATNTPGDADSVYKITAPGSYYLTGNMTGVGAKNGIEIAANDVTIDLMGFEVLGVAGSLDGVTTMVAGFTGIEVRNGTIRSWGDEGLNFGTFTVYGARVDGIRAVGNGGIGIFVGQRTAIDDCVATENLGGGILTDSNAIISRCVASNNTGTGINAGSGSSVSQCASEGNSTNGITAGSGTTVTACSAYNNDNDGVSVSGGGTISACSAYFNSGDGFSASGGAAFIFGCAAIGNTGDGIRISNDCLVIGNTCDTNGSSGGDGAGIQATGSDNRIEGNNCTDNDRGIDVDAAGNIIIRNTCSGNTTSNWDIVANNNILVIDATAALAGAVSGDAGGVSPGSTNAHANFTY